MNSIEEKVRNIVKEELGLYDTEKRRTANEIRDQLQEELRKRPKTTHELTNAINSSRSTVENHCSHLENLGILEQETIEETKYWKLREDSTD
jgi:predicted transcriptional regulator